ncbi:hypothetical protein GRAN_3258 [Granulicella sibirica]|uniref:Uncharacterized protein n=1 Tax=Granulicella sibirica TaxID=2479048 RepID=A0A4Q0T4A0_9BACT|nr:hypothetical protein GRAN_3258 [Granulicella sibirica]
MHGNVSPQTKPHVTPRHKPRQLSGDLQLDSPYLGWRTVPIVVARPGSRHCAEREDTAHCQSSTL